MNWLVVNSRERRLEAKVMLEYVNDKIAKAVAQAVSPDNFITPIGLSVKTVRENNKVITQIQCEGKIVTLTSTIDDLLFSVSAVEKALKTINKF